MMINHTPFDMRVVGLSILLADGESQGVTKLPSLSHLTEPVVSQLVLTGRLDLERTIAQVLGSQVGSYLGQGLGNIVNTGIGDIERYFTPKTPAPSYTAQSSPQRSNQNKLDDLSRKTNHEQGIKKTPYHSTAPKKNWADVNEVFENDWERKAVSNFDRSLYPKDLELPNEGNLMQRYQAAPSRSKERWQQPSSVNSNASVGKIAEAYGEGVVSGLLAPLYAMDYAMNNPTALAVGLAMNFYNGIHPIQNVQNMIHGVENSWDHLVHSDPITRAKRLGELSALPLGSGLGASISKMFGSKMALGGLGVAGSTAIIEEVGAKSAIGLTTRLNRTQLKDYLANVQNVSREQLVKDLRSIGLEFKGGSEDGKFLSFIDKYSNKRIDVHPPDTVGTDYYHIHVFDKKGNSLNNQLEIVDRRSSEAHIEINSDYGYKPELPYRRTM
ncbi:MAG: hypothetical protein H0U71_07925 [Gammaproteobacteria bacterium]|nr:hypothetical protein [Gammaproteobacteria bacterium]